MAEKNNLDDIPESYQRYLDEIYTIASKKRGGWVTNKEIALSLGVEPASVSGMLEKLKENNLINWEPRKAIRLSKKGKEIAMQLNENHQLLLLFFKKVLKLKDNLTIDALACQIEHHISQDVKESLKIFLDKYLNQN
ncbi:MAG: metal-dependent transcriptional regulator [Candidatus Lokiarchaeota archaeon]|nr:metal-dependent transcriptional regulator [Candidatus Lokiarchaeota archaeon]